MLNIHTGSNPILHQIADEVPNRQNVDDLITMLYTVMHHNDLL